VIIRTSYVIIAGISFQGFTNVAAGADWQTNCGGPNANTCESQVRPWRARGER
jgi:hypothetical protein